MAGKKWELAAAVARHLVKVEPENAAWWINLACATRRCESVEKAEAILIQARRSDTTSTLPVLLAYSEAVFDARPRALVVSVAADLLISRTISRRALKRRFPRSSITSAK